MSKRGLLGALLGFVSWADGLGDLTATDRYAVAYKPKRKKFKPSRQKRKRK